MANFDLEKLRRLIEEEKLQQHVAATRLGVSRSSVGRWCKKFGIATQRTGPRSGPLHTNWKGGRKLVGRYWYIYFPNHPMRTQEGYVAEHRLAMEAKLGRYLTRSEVVHHKDGDPGNNDPANLEVFPTNGEHLRQELKGRVPNWTPEGKARILTANLGKSRRRPPEERGD